MLGLLIVSARDDVKRVLQKPNYLRVHMNGGYRQYSVGFGGGLGYVRITVEA